MNYHQLLSRLQTINNLKQIIAQLTFAIIHTTFQFHLSYKTNHKVTKANQIAMYIRERNKAGHQ